MKKIYLYCALTLGVFAMPCFGQNAASPPATKTATVSAAPTATASKPTTVTTSTATAAPKTATTVAPVTVAEPAPKTAEISETEVVETPQGTKVIESEEIVNLEEPTPDELANRHKIDRHGYRHITSYERKATAFEKKSQDTGRDLSQHQPPPPRSVDMPFGNFGLNAVSKQVSDWQSDLYNKTGITPFADYYGTYLTNPYGGNEQGGNYTSILFYGINADMEKMVGWKGATLTISGAFNTGANLSDTIGNYLTVSNTYVTNGVMFYELYLKQEISIGDDTMNLLLGRMSMSDVFASLPVFSLLVSGAMNSAPAALYSDAPYHTGPIATWGGVLQYETKQALQFSVGAYQIPSSFTDPDYHGTDFGFHDDAGYMLMGQVQWSPVFGQEMNKGKPVANTGLPGVYQLGAYYARDLPLSAEISFGEQSRDNVYGFYAQGQQMLWRDPSNAYRSVSMWGGVQWAPLENVSIVPLMFYSGVQLQGFVPERDLDLILISWMYGSFSSRYSNWNVAQGGNAAGYEHAIEISYIYQINKHISIQPDLQYIMRPYGNTGITDALVIGAQINVSF